MLGSRAMIWTGRWSVTVALLVAGAGLLRGENHALLVGVPSTPLAPAIAPLEGPGNDVAALRQALGDWGFSAGRIRTLVGRSASRDGILDALDRLVDGAGAGDGVFVYFSGHGTGPRDPKTGGFGMDARTGALVPADFRYGSARETLSRLIVGSRDIRPRLERLDASGAEALVVFDACYSGDTAKSPARLVPRFAGPPADAAAEWAAEFAASLPAEGGRSSWPYERVVYISASARDELAWDIPLREARGARPTIDGLAHGVLTNGLLLALGGEADRDGNRSVDYAELHEYLLESVHDRGQTPLLHPRDRPLVDRALWGMEVAPVRRGPRAGSQALRVRIDPREPELAALLEDAGGIELTDGEHDLAVRLDSGRYRICLASGVEIGGASLADAGAVAGWLRRRARSQRIAGLVYPAQDIRLSMRLDPDHGVYYRGERLRVSMRAGSPAWLLLVAIDSAGEAVVIYPADPSQARPAAAGAWIEAVEVAAVAPFGTDRLEAFAFRDKPAGYDDWVGLRGRLDLAGMERMERMLGAGADQPGRAHTGRSVTTRGGR